MEGNTIKKSGDGLRKRKNLHDGHRKRLKHKLVNDSSETLEHHELLEVLLFYSISRRNTNETAHELLDEFGNFSNLLNAKSEDLKEVYYIKDSSAALILALGEMKRRKDRFDSKYNFSISYESCTENVLKLMKTAKHEGTYIIWVNRKGGLLLANRITADNSRLEERLFFCRHYFNVGVGGAIIVSFSKGCDMIPSSIVLEKAKAFEEKLGLYTVSLFEYYLYNGESIVGVKGKSKFDVSSFDQNEIKNGVDESIKISGQEKWR